MSVDVINLSFSYGSNRVLDDVSFSVEKGQLMAVLGANGVGKSTLFKCMLQLREGYTGSVCINGKDCRKLSRKELSSLIAYIPQSSNAVFNYTVFDTVLMGVTGAVSLFHSPAKEQVEETWRALEMLHITDLAERGISEISGGEQQLALIARAIVQRAEVLIMDEPTASLDYGNQHRVLQMIRKLCMEGYTVLMSTHNPEYARQYATHILAMKDGRVLCSGDADRVNAELIRELYGDICGMQTQWQELQPDRQEFQSYRQDLQPDRQESQSYRQ